MTTASASARRDSGPAPSMDDILAQIRRTLADAVEPAGSSATALPLAPAPAHVVAPDDLLPDLRDDRRATTPAAPAPADDLSDLIETDDPIAATPSAASPISQSAPPSPSTSIAALPPPLPAVLSQAPRAPTPTEAEPAAPATPVAAAPAASDFAARPATPPEAPSTAPVAERPAEVPLLVVPPPARGLLSIRELAVNRLDGTTEPGGLTVPSHIGARPVDIAPSPMQQPAATDAPAAPPQPPATPTAARPARGALGALEASLAAGGLATTAEPPAPANPPSAGPAAAPAAPADEARVVPFVVPAGLEDGIVDALRPALRAWLDETVPRLAEQAARAAATRRD